MLSPELEAFGELLVKHVRDRAIQSCDTLRHPDAKSVSALRWKEIIKDGDVRSILDAVIPDVVDDTIFFLLNSIDQNLLPLWFKASNGTMINLDDGSGESAGWYLTDEGWCAKYTNERFVED
jgi:hypothetical protein